MSKYEILSTNSKVVGDITVYQIRALISISRYGISSGDLGGYVESESNLSQDGDCWIGVDASVYGDARIVGDSYIGGSCRFFREQLSPSVIQIDGPFEIKYSEIYYDDVP